MYFGIHVSQLHNKAEIFKLKLLIIWISINKVSGDVPMQDIFFSEMSQMTIYLNVIGLFMEHRI